MRYVVGHWYLALLLALPACVPGELSPTITTSARGLSSLSLDENGCDLTHRARVLEYFQRARVQVSNVTPRTLGNLSGDPLIALDAPANLDLLNPSGGLAPVLRAFPPGEYQTAQLRLDTAELILKALPDKVFGLNVPKRTLEIDFLVPFVVPEREAGPVDVIACVEGLQVENGIPKLAPNRIKVVRARFVAQE